MSSETDNIRSYYNISDCLVNNVAYKVHELYRNDTVKRRSCEENKCKQECRFYSLEPAEINTTYCLYDMFSRCSEPNKEASITYSTPDLKQIREYCLCLGQNYTSLVDDDPMWCACYNKQWKDCLKNHNKNHKEYEEDEEDEEDDEDDEEDEEKKSCTFMIKKCNNEYIPNNLYSIQSVCEIQNVEPLFDEDYYYNDTFNILEFPLFKYNITNLVDPYHEGITIKPTQADDSKEKILLSKFKNHLFNHDQLSLLSRIRDSRKPVTYDYMEDSTPENGYFLKQQLATSNSNNLNPNFFNSFFIIIFILFMYSQLLQKAFGNVKRRNKKELD